MYYVCSASVSGVKRPVSLFFFFFFSIHNRRGETKSHKQKAKDVFEADNHKLILPFSLPAAPL